MPADWYAGVCDRMLQVLAWWVANWPRGEEYATRQKVNLKLENGVEDVVVKRLVKVPFHLDELQHLVRILKVAAPKEEMTTVLGLALKGFGGLRIRQGTQRLVPLASYQVEAREVFDCVLGVRDGKSGLDARIEEARASGKSLWD